MKSFNAVVRIPSGKHHPALNNKQSSEFKGLEKQLCSKVRNKLPFSFKRTPLESGLFLFSVIRAVSFKTKLVLFFFLKFLIVTEAYGGHSIEVGREVVCVAGGIFVFVFFLFCGSQSKS